MVDNEIARIHNVADVESASRQTADFGILAYRKSSILPDTLRQLKHNVAASQGLLENDEPVLPFAFLCQVKAEADLVHQIFVIYAINDITTARVATMQTSQSSICCGT